MKAQGQNPITQHRSTSWAAATISNTQVGFRWDEGFEALQTATLKSDDNIQFKGKNIFAVPRNVRTLGLSANKSKTVEEGDEKPKSNDEFRKMFIKEG